jgi:hypothetical protein
MQSMFSISESFTLPSSESGSPSKISTSSLSSPISRCFLKADAMDSKVVDYDKVSAFDNRKYVLGNSKIPI